LGVRAVRWRHGVLVLTLNGVPRNGRVPVELEYSRHRARRLVIDGGRLQVRTPRPVAIVIRLLVGRRQIGRAITVRLDRRLVVRITNPTRGETVSGRVPIAATADDGVAIASVRFAVDGKRVGRPVTMRPYVVHWNTKTARSGRHTITALATDVSGNTATTSVLIDVQNPAPPMTCFVLQAHVDARGHGSATTAAVHTATSGETLLALVSADGPAGARRQSATVSGAGLRWRLVKRVNGSSGDSEIWTATAPRILRRAQITSTLANSGFDESITVVALEGTRGVGAASGASGSTGAPRVSLRTRFATSLVFAVGNDWDRAIARVLPVGWVRLDQWVDADVGDTFWSQYTNQPTGRAHSLISVHVAAPTTDQWNLVAVEVVNSGT
jgi:hypothetical protein